MLPLTPRNKLPFGPPGWTVRSCPPPIAPPLMRGLATDPAHRVLLSAYCQFSRRSRTAIAVACRRQGRAGETPTAAKTAQPLPWLRWPILAGAALTVAAALAVILWQGRPQNQFQNIATRSPSARRLHAKKARHRPGCTRAGPGREFTRGPVCRVALNVRAIGEGDLLALGDRGSRCSEIGSVGRPCHRITAKAAATVSAASGHKSASATRGVVGQSSRRWVSASSSLTPASKRQLLFEIGGKLTIGGQEHAVCRIGGQPRIKGGAIGGGQDRTVQPGGPKGSLFSA